MKLTNHDNEILDYIKKYMKENGATPTIEEVARGTYLSKASAYVIFGKLIDLGYVTQISRYRYTVKGMKYVEE